MFSKIAYYAGSFTVAGGALTYLLKDNGTTKVVRYPTTRLDTNFAEINISKINSDSRLTITDGSQTTTYHPSECGLVPVRFENRKSGNPSIEAENIEHLSLRRIRSNNVCIYMYNRK